MKSTIPATRPLRILALTSSTGSGHDMRARAFRAWVRRIAGNGAEVRVAHVIEDGGPVGRFGVWVYNRIQRHWPRLHHVYWHIVEVIGASHQGRVTYGGRHYRRLLTEYRPAAVVSFHDSTNRGYFEDARRVLGADCVFCATYSGEWSGGYGFSRNWVNPTADLYAARTPAGLERALALGMLRERTRILCKFLPPEAFARQMDNETRRRFRNALDGLNTDRFTVFLATGGYGANHHLPFLEALLPLRDTVQVFAVCGRNEEALSRLRAWKADHPEMPLHIEGFSARMHHYLQVSDCVVTRGGANTMAEALHFDCPVIFDTLGGDMPQERLTITYFTDNGAGVAITSPRGLADAVARWADRGEAFQEARSAMRRLDVDDTPEAFTGEILAAARARAGKSPHAAAIA